MRVAQLGKGLAVELPTSVVEALDLKAGDEVEIPTVSKRSLEVASEMTREKALDALRKFRGRLPADFKFDRDEANAR